MSGDVSVDVPHRTARRSGFAPTELEKNGLKFDTGAPVTGAVAVGKTVAASFGDGTIRFFHPDHPPVVANAHHGAVLCLQAGASHVVTGGDDGRFLRISPDGAVGEIAGFGTRWVDCVATCGERYACSSGRVVHIWGADGKDATQLEHPSTVGGLAFDAKGGRLAVAHYGGVTLWEHGDRRWNSTQLVWKGSHGAVSFSPDGKFLVSSMQENTLHGWRLSDNNNMQMAGYPSKIKSFAWVGDTPYLATSGADEAICWPFDGKNGPMDRAPLCVAYGGKQLATVVQTLPGQPAVLVGFQDGAVLLGELDESKAAIILRGTTGAEVTAIAVSNSLSHILIGDTDGCVLWAPLRPGSDPGDDNARHV